MLRIGCSTARVAIQQQVYQAFRIGNAVVDCVQSCRAFSDVLRRGASILLMDAVDVECMNVLRSDRLRNTPVLALLLPVRSETHLIVDLIRSGANDVVIVGIDDLSQKVSDALTVGRSNFGRSIRDLGTTAPTLEASEIINACLEHVLRGEGLREVAIGRGQSPRTLARRFSRSGLPTPGRLMRWVRLLLAVEELQQSRRSAVQIARSHGYSSLTAFRHALQVTAGLRPSQARTRNAFESMMHRFNEEIKYGLIRRSGA